MTEQGRMAITATLSPVGGFEKHGSRMERFLGAENCPHPFFHCTVFQKKAGVNALSHILNFFLRQSPSESHSAYDLAFLHL